MERMADPRVRVLAVSLVQFSNGYKVDLARLSKRARETNTFLVVDAIQGLGAVPVDLQATPVDILSCGGQKWLLSPWGSGFVYVRKELIPAVQPVVMGWMAFEGTDDFTRLTDYDPRLRDDARRYEMISLPFQDFAGFNTSLDLLLDVGVPAIAAHIAEVQRAGARLGGAAGDHDLVARREARVGHRLREGARAGGGLQGDPRAGRVCEPAGRAPSGSARTCSTRWMDVRVTGCWAVETRHAEVSSSSDRLGTQHDGTRWPAQRPPVSSTSREPMAGDERLASCAGWTASEIVRRPNAYRAARSGHRPRARLHPVGNDYLGRVHALRAPRCPAHSPTATRNSSSPSAASRTRPPAGRRWSASARRRRSSRR